jgi:Mg2+ and Co2+ transporter CorA
MFYLQTHTGAFDLTDPNSLKVFAEKIVASHYLKLAEFLQAGIERVQYTLSRWQDFTTFVITAVEGQWSDVQALIRRVGEYKDDLEAILLQLRIPFEKPNLKRTADWKDSTTDYQFLYLRFNEISARANGLNSSTATLAGLTSSYQAVKAQELALEAAQRSIQEAKSVKTLTVLGILFIPPALVSSIFSMSDPYRPGGKLFWVYFIVAFPLIVLVFLGYFILELGYVGGGMRWSVRATSTAVSEKLE